MSPRNTVSFDRERALSRARTPNVAVIRAKMVLLRCGHRAELLPVVSHPVSSRPDTYRCPFGCGLQRGR